MISNLANDYRTLLRLIPELINISGYRNDYISKKMKLNPATFSAKKLKGNWSADEVVKLVAIIENNDVDDFLMLELMREAKNDELISASEFRKEIANWK